MINIKRASTDAELHGILSLQRANLAVNLSGQEYLSQGFVSVVHSFEDLEMMNREEPHVIACDNQKLVAYLLAMTPQAKSSIPMLVPMFELFAHILYSGKTIADFNFIVVGQVCVDRNYRGIGLLDQCYAFYKQQFSGRYEFAITEIVSSNQRSMSAHRRIGFREIYNYETPDGTPWSIVLWDWRRAD